MTTAPTKRGPGRVAEDGATGLTNVSFALTEQQKAWIRSNGSSLKVRALINEAMDKDKAPPKEKRAPRARS